MSLLLLLSPLLLAVSPPPSSVVDDGMWTFDNPPLERLQKDHGFKPDKDWFDRVRLACVRFPGGSGSFVSADGLVMTNHHVGLDSIQKLSTKEKDLVKEGFYAPTRDAELKCPDLELRVLESTEDVTKRVQGAVKEGAIPKEANEQRKAEMARIEKEEKEKTGLECTVVNLYQGGFFHLYRYKVHADVRLVFAPEQQVAFYGGDPDNFTYPRYDLDCSFFRVYEEGKPCRPKSWFRWSAAGPKDGELVFVSGNPGSTGRLLTFAQTEYDRDVLLPQTLRYNRGMRAALKAYSAQGEQEERQAKDDLFNAENSIKARTGFLGGLENPQTMARKKAEEERLLSTLGSDTKEGVALSKAIASIAAARKGIIPTATRMRFSRAESFLGDVAITLVRMTAELEKKNEDRLPEYRETALDSLRRRIFSPRPVYLDLEEARLAEGFRQGLAELGLDDPFVKAALGGKSPSEAAAAALRGTKLG
ncbi:MAG: S46 family peptidase, partial [Planctomycetota bacterium]